jgi:hypothetical protein
LIGKVLGVGRFAFTLATAAAVAAVAWTPVGSAAKPCWQVLVDDWADGAISNLYPISCYRQALQNMPEDVRLYSNASDEINRALTGRAIGRSIAGGVKPGTGMRATAAIVPRDDRSGAPLILAAALAALLTLAASGGYLARRKWRGAARLGGPDG